MSLEAKPLSVLTSQDLQELVDSKALEDLTHEFKRDLPTNSEHDRMEFLYDVSSFANSSGGYIIYGLEELDGEAHELVGVAGVADGNIQRLEQLANSGIEPPIPGLHIVAIPLDENQSAMVLHVPRSPVLPHMVCLQGQSKFFQRGSNGKHPLGVSEIRVLFERHGSVARWVREFRAARLAQIEAEDGPIPLVGQTMAVLHVVPLAAADPGFAIDLRRVLAVRQSPLAHPMGVTAHNDRCNIDGFLTSSASDPKGRVRSYLQLFRSGCLESAGSSVLYDRDDSRVFYGNSYEDTILESLERHLALLEAVGVPVPLSVMLSFVGVRGCIVLRTGPQAVHHAWEPEFDRSIRNDALLLPEVVLESYSADVKCMLRPAFDALWNASGYDGSPSYNDKGDWVRQ